MAAPNLSTAILDFLIHRARNGVGPASPAEITANARAARPTVNRHLRKLVAAGRIVREGAGPATVYSYQQPSSSANNTRGTAPTPVTTTATTSPPWSDDARTLRARLEEPIGSRKPVSYRRQFVDDYHPNHSWLLPPKLAAVLFSEGRM